MAEDSLYTKLAKKGYLGTRAKVTAEAGPAPWRQHSDSDAAGYDNEVSASEERERQARRKRERNAAGE